MAVDQIKLPVAVASRYDIARLLREIETLGEQLAQANIRAAKSATGPTISSLLSALAADNKLDIAKPEVLKDLQVRLQDLKETAPLVHISFAVEPDALVSEKVVLWFRREISPTVLVQFGVQPSIAAGCVLRTPSHYFDFSLRNHLLKNSDLLLQKLKALR